jgi:hypothetical protein
MGVNIIHARSRLWKTADAGQQAWWEGLPVVGAGSNVHFDLDSWIGIPMLRKALEGGPPLHMANFDGNLVVRAEALQVHLQDAYGLKPLRNSYSSRSAGILYGSSETMLSLMIDSGDVPKAYLQMATTNKEAIQKLTKLAGGILQQDDPKRGFVFALAQGAMGGYNLKRIGAAGTPIERGNYTAGVLKQYDHVVADLKADSPCGRLVIMAGMPGSGKTFLARSLLADVPSAAFIVVPPHLVKDLGSPELIPALVSAKDHGFDGPIVLVLEDADSVLVQRQAGDMAAISSLLNLGDGILGGVLDARILATTNAAKLDMDEATRRKGRLCQYMSVEALSAEHASQVISRLAQKSITANRPVTLAEIYHAARDFGWTPPSKLAEKPRTVYRDEILGMPEAYSKAV